MQSIIIHHPEIMFIIPCWFGWIYEFPASMHMSILLVKQKTIYAYDVVIVTTRIRFCIINFCPLDVRRQLYHDSSKSISFVLRCWSIKQIVCIVQIVQGTWVHPNLVTWLSQIEMRLKIRAIYNESIHTEWANHSRENQLCSGCWANHDFP